VQQPVAQLENEIKPVGQQPVDQLKIINNAYIFHHIGGKLATQIPWGIISSFCQSKVAGRSLFPYSTNYLR